MKAIQSSQSSSSTEILGNAPQELKEVIFKVFSKYFWTPHVGKFFGSTLLQDVRVVQVTTDDDEDCPVKGRDTVKIVCSFVVTPEMCDRHQRMHGGCIAFMTDMLTSNVFLLTRRPTVSLNLNVVQHSPIPVGTPLHAVVTAVNASDHVHDARLKIFDASNGALLATGEHLEMRPSAGPQTVAQDMEIPSDADRTVPFRQRNDDRRSVTEISGSADVGIKQRVIDIFRSESLSLTDTLFAESVIRRIRIREIGSKENEGKPTIRMVCETEVKQDMLNGMRTLHGGCGCYLVQECSSTLLHALGGEWQGLNLNTNFHAPALRDSTVKIVTTTTSTGKRVSSLRVEILDSKTSRLLVSGTSTFLRIQSPSARL